MNPSELLAKRRDSWNELSMLCDRVAKKSHSMDPAGVMRFASLYRSACADLALAEAYQLPPNVVQQLQQLVGRAHSVMYRRRVGPIEHALREMPRAVATDPYVHTAFAIFWVLFVVFCLLVKSGSMEGLAESVAGEAMLQQAEQSYSGGTVRTTGQNIQMTGFYIWNNTGIGLQCFALCVFVLPGLAILGSNAVTLGTVFGYMLRPECGPASDHFQTFVMSHGPFELSAIVLSAGAGLRIGMSWIDTGGLTRRGALLQGCRKAMPVILLAVLLFLGAACVEGLMSALDLGALTIYFKGTLSWLTSTLLMFYIVVVGILKPHYDDDLDLDPDRELGREELWI